MILQLTCRVQYMYPRTDDPALEAVAAEVGDEVLPGWGGGWTEVALHVAAQNAHAHVLLVEILREEEEKRNKCTT